MPEETVFETEASTGGYIVNTPQEPGGGMTEGTYTTTQQEATGSTAVPAKSVDDPTKTKTSAAVPNGLPQDRVTSGWLFSLLGASGILTTRNVMRKKKSDDS